MEFLRRIGLPSAPQNLGPKPTFELEAANRKPTALTIVSLEVAHLAAKQVRY